MKMTSKTSEAELTALERSKDQPVQLIDHAARIAGVKFDERTKSYGTQKASQSDSRTDFRQQWLLKWLLKRLNEASSSSTKNSKNPLITSVVSHQQAWAFLSYLLQHISNQNLTDILLERNFSGILCECASIVLKQYVPVSDRDITTAAIPYTSHGTDERPQKRRRLPNDNEEHSSSGGAQSTENDHELDLPASLLEVVSEFAKALHHASGVSEGATRKTIPSWATSTKEAAILIGSVVELANVLLQRSHDTQKSELAFHAVTSCLSLWQDYSSADSALDKRLVHTHFNEACLVGCLDMLQSMRDQRHSDTARAARTIIERQIAMHTLLPVRSMFTDACSSSWKLEQNVISWSNIEKPYTRFTSHLGAALLSEIIAGSEFLSLRKVEHASLLIEVASRLVPKADVRRRQWERPWFEALTLILYHLAFPKDLYRLEKTEKYDLEPTGTVLPPDPQKSMLWPIQYLNTIRDQQLSLSTPTLCYLTAATLLWRGQSPPISVLSQLLALDVDCFIPQPSISVYQTCLDRLMTILEELTDSKPEDLAQITQKIVIPLMRGFARSRDLKGFLELWSPHLEDALRARTTSNLVSGAFDPSFVWDDEHLFHTFESLCVVEAPQGVTKELLADVTKRIRSIAQKIGSTADVFAQVAILISVLRARSLELISPGGAVWSLAELAKAVCDALAETNDYQGQRWRLWSLLRTLQSFDAVKFAERKLYTRLWTLITSTFSRMSLSSDKPNAGQYAYQMFEAFQCFVFLTECGSTSDEYHKQACDIAAKQLSVTLDKCLHMHTSRGRVRSKSWDGRIESPANIDQLLCGCLAALLRKPKFAQLAITRDMISTLEKLSIENVSDFHQTTSGYRSVGDLSQALLITLDEITNKSAFQDLAEILLENSAHITPSVMHSLPMDGVDKTCINNLAEQKYQEVLKAVAKSKQETIENTSTSLALLARLVTHYPVSVGLPDQFSKLCKLVQTADTSHAYESAIPMRSSLIKIIDVFQGRVLKMENGEKRSVLMDQMRTYLKDKPKSIRSAQNHSSSVQALLHTVASHLLDGGRYEISGFQPAEGSAQHSDAMVHHLKKPDQIATTELVDNLVAVNMQTMSKQDDNPTLSNLESLHEQINEQSGLASCLKIAASIDRFSKEEIRSSPEITQILNAMATLENAADETDPLQLVLKLESSILVLNAHASIVNQASVDTLLQSLASIASSTSKISKPTTINEVNPTQFQPSAIYDRLITLLSILLTRHRRRLSGRTHLLLPLLQNLLKCLFYTSSKVYIHQNPSTTKQKQAFRSSLPQWLHLDPNNKPLPSSSAEKYSRILSSICNPTTASARSAHRANNASKTMARDLDLNDETSKAKRLAAQYMQYVIMEFARCTLDGVIAPETRDKLIPGLYVVLDALDRDLMRAMNAAMDPSSRAIFKGLYDEWVRFGRWDQN